jgi:hypothetical protein
MASEGKPLKELNLVFKAASGGSVLTISEKAGHDSKKGW